jgi:hypothetical protein
MPVAIASENDAGCIDASPLGAAADAGARCAGEAVISARFQA